MLHPDTSLLFVCDFKIKALSRVRWSAAEQGEGGLSKSGLILTSLCDATSFELVLCKS